MKILYITFLCFLPFFAKAQYSFSKSTTGNISVSSIQSLTLTGGTLTPSFNTTDDYSNGKTMDNYLSASIKSNVSWTLGVNAQSTYFTPMNGGSVNMPASVLSIKTDNTSYFPVSTTSQTLKTGYKGGNTTAGNTFHIDLKFNPGFSYKGGIYTLGLLYTLSQQ